MVEIDCEKPMKLETSPKVTKSKRSLHWCRSISKKISVQVLLQYQSKSYYIIGQEVYYIIGQEVYYIIGQEVYYSIGRFYYIIGQLLHYQAFFITLSGSYYSIGRLLHYRLVQGLLSVVEPDVESVSNGASFQSKSASHLILLSMTLSIILLGCEISE